MPVDANGVRAHSVMDGEATLKRTNSGRFFEQYINATSRMVGEKVSKMVGDNPTKTAIMKAWEYLLGYYRIVAPKMVEVLLSPSYTPGPVGHVMEVANKKVPVDEQGVFLQIPPDNPVDGPEMIQLLRKHYPISITPVTYRGRSGRVVTTKKPVLIGSLYLMLLEKTGRDWSGVASSKLQHFGLPAKLSKSDKYATPSKPQPIRLLGETETRLVAATCGGEIAYALLEASNNPAYHKAINTNILSSDTPSQLERAVFKDQVGQAGSRALLLVDHTLACSGISLVDRPYVEKQPVIYPPEPTVDV